MATHRSGFPLPGPGEIHVYWADLDDPEPDGDAVLCPDERARASRFHHLRDRARFAAARVNLRRLLAAYLGDEPERIRFEHGRHGKPRLGGRHARDPLRFNVSHGGARVLYALTAHAEVGIDVEALRPIPDGLDLAERFFSPSEVASLRGFSARARDRAFLRCWTRKEAFVKALGDGLSHPFDRFSVSLEEEANGEVGLSVAGDGPVTHRLLSLYPDEQHVAALALEGPRARITRFQSMTAVLGTGPARPVAVPA